MTDSATDINFGFESALALTGKLVLAAVGFVGSLIFARLLGPRDFGAFYVLLAWLQVASRPVQGVSEAAKQRLAGGSAPAGELLGGVTLAIGAAALVIAGGITVVASKTILGGLPAAPAIIILLFTTLSAAEAYRTVFTATGRLARDTGLDLIGSLLTVPAQLVLVLSGLGVVGMALGLAGASTVVAVLAVIALGTPLRWPKSETRKVLWSYARVSAVERIVNKAYLRLDLLLIGSLLHSTAAGYYEVAVKLTMPAVYAAAVVATGLFARTSAFAATDDTLGIQQDIHNARSFASVLAIPLAVGSAVLATPLITALYGTSYVAAAPLLIGVAAYQIPRTQSMALQATLKGLDRPDLVLRVSIVAVIVNVLLGVAFLEMWDALGVVIATVLTEIARFVTLLWVVHFHVDGIDLTPRPMAMQVLAATAMGAVVWGGRQMLAPLVVLEIISLVAIGVVIYAGALMTLSSVTRETTLDILADI